MHPSLVTETAAVCQAGQKHDILPTLKATFNILYLHEITTISRNTNDLVPKLAPSYT